MPRDQPQPKRPQDPQPRSIDRQHRVILPPEVMEALGVGTGDYVGFRIEGKKVVLLKARWMLEG